VAAVNSAGTGVYSITIIAESDGKSYYQRGIFTTSFVNCETKLCYEVPI